MTNILICIVGILGVKYHVIPHRVNSARLYIILHICFAIRNDLKQISYQCARLKKPLNMCYHFFRVISHFVFILTKYGFSFAIEYCLILHKKPKQGKTSPKNITEIFIYFYEICLHVFFLTNIKFSPCKFFTV